MSLKKHKKKLWKLIGIELDQRLKDKEEKARSFMFKSVLDEIGYVVFKRLDLTTIQFTINDISGEADNIIINLL